MHEKINVDLRDGDHVIYESWPETVKMVTLNDLHYEQHTVIKLLVEQKKSIVQGSSLGKKSIFLLKY